MYSCQIKRRHLKIGGESTRGQVQKTFDKSAPCARKAPVRGAPPNQRRALALSIVLRCNHQFDILWLSDGKAIIYILPTHSHIGYPDRPRLAGISSYALPFPLLTASSHSNFCHRWCRAPALSFCHCPQILANPSVPAPPHGSCPPPLFARSDCIACPGAGAPDSSWNATHVRYTPPPRLIQQIRTDTNAKSQQQL